MSYKLGWEHYLSPTPKNISKILLALRAVLGVVSAAAIIEQSSPTVQLIILGLGALLHEAGMFFAEDKTVTNGTDDKL